MGDTLKLALQLTAVDMMSGILDRVKRHVVGLGQAGEEVGRHFESMNRHLTSGLKAAAASRYMMEKIAHGITPAADLQEAMIDVKMSLMRQGQHAKVLNDELKQVRDTAIELQSISPFNAQDVVNVQKELLQGGLEFGDVVGNGAARAAVVLATITKDSTELASSVMLRIGVPYKLEAKDYGQLADVIQKHAMSGPMHLPQLNESLPYVAKVAKSFGVPWEDLLTGLAVEGEQGDLGSMAGTHLKDFYERMVGASRISRKSMSGLNAKLASEHQAPLEFWDKQGELLPTHEIIKSLRASLGTMDTHHKQFYLQKIFGEQGGQAALSLMATGKGSWEFVKEKVEETAAAEKKVEERLKGLNAQVQTLGGNAKTTLSVMFDPMLGAVTAVTKGIGNMVFGVGKFADHHETLTAGANVLLGGAAVGAAGYGAYHLLRAAVSGGKVLKGVGGIKGLLKGGAGTAMGIAEGKALQAATGVNPVFVTNWPAGGIGGSGLSTAAETAAGASLPGLLAKGKGLLTAAAGLNLTTASAGVGAAAVGYGIGTGINRALGWLSGKMSDGKYSGAGWLGQRIFDATHTKNDIKLDISIDGNGRVTTKSSDPNTKSSINLKRGSFTGDPLLDMNL